MPKKDFSFHYDIKTKTGKMKIGKKYINLSISDKKIKSFTSGSGVSGGYGINLIWED